MKTCPVCKAVAFDDAEICYGCLYRYRGGEGLVEAPVEKTKGAAKAPGFTIRFVPEEDDSGAVIWSCFVEQVAGTGEPGMRVPQQLR